MKAVFEKIDFHEGSSIVAFRFVQPNFDAPWHFHPEYELTYIVRSTGIRYVGNDISNFGPGDLVLVGPNLPHCWVNDQKNTTTGEAIVIQWSQQVYHDIPEFSTINELLRLADQGLQFDSDKHQTQIALISELEQQAPIDRFITLTKILVQLAKGSAFYKLAAPFYEPDLSNNTNNRISRVHFFVQKNFDRKIKLEEVASELNMTEQSFSRFFSKVMGKPFFVFLNEYRCNMASRFLLETDLQVAEIGYKCGYESSSFFYQQFKKFKKYSPLGFRKMYRKLS